MSIRPAICSHSLGRAWVHSLPEKLDAAQRHGFDIELFYEDLFYVAGSLPGGATPSNHIVAAQVIRELCDERGVTVICLQPFMHYEGLKDRQRHAERVEEMKLWMQLAKILGTDTISIPSTFLSEQEASGDFDPIVSDMREIADLCHPEGIQLSYEALSWGTFCDTWEQSWEVVRHVDRPNFGICLDTFNIAARVYADPTASSGKNPSADEDMRLSLERLVQTVDVNKIVFVQVVDAEYLAEPLLEGHKWYNASQPARMSWSRNCRLFYGESGTYLPVHAILKAILVDLGYKGRMSAEMFNISLTDPDPDVPEQHARRAAESWRKIVEDFGLDSFSAPRVHGRFPGQTLSAHL